MKHLHLCSAFTLTTLLIGILSSCGGGNAPAETTAADTPPAETVDPATVLDLPEKDWGGREFRVLGYDNTREQFRTFEVVAESENGEVVNDAIFRRNQTIEERYNVKITEYKDGSNNDANTSTAPYLRKMVMAGEDAFDLAFCTVKGIGTLAREGLLYDLNTIDYIDFSKNWWNPEVNDALSISGKLYFTSSDFSLRDKSRAYILVHNRDMEESFKLQNPAELVRAGTWTIDKMAEYTKAVASDLNGNTEIDDEDRFGLGMDSYNAFSTFMVACDTAIVAKNKTTGLPEPVVNTERVVDAVDKVLNLTAKPNEAIFCNDWNGKVSYDYWSVMGTVFKKGNAMFITTFPHGLKAYSADCNFNYGIVPYPKFDEDQEGYYTMADIYCMLFGVPISCADPDFAGFMLEALSAEGSTTSLPAYYEVSCKTKYTYDEESAEMLDLTFSGIRYELAMVFGVESIRTLYESLGGKKANTIASDYAAKESAAKADIEKLIADFAGTK